MGPAFRQDFKRCEQRFGVFLLSKPSHIEEKFSLRRDSQRAAGLGPVIRMGRKGLGINAESAGVHIAHTPIFEDTR